MLNPHTGVLLINLGTPTAPKTKPVRAFLREFLMDERVIDIPRVWRWLLVNGVILPTRPRTTAKAYQQIWTDNGSPLWVNSLHLSEKLALALGKNYQVELGMRYGQPNILFALNNLLKIGCRKIVILPLFPQYSSAATGSAITKSLKILQTVKAIPNVEIINCFYNSPAFIEAWRQVIEENRPAVDPEMWLFSYHGLPLRQVQNTGHPCYRTQCLDTSHQIAKSLGIDSQRYRISFQSRLGRIPWLTPYTDKILPELAQQGVKRLAVVCPSFVADCLETLEEIGIRAKEQWSHLGGTHFSLIPSLNVHPAWVKALSHLVIEKKA